MTVAATARKAGPFVGDGINAAFAFAFKVFLASEMVVTQTDLLGNETTLALTTDYTVALNADQDANPGGTVTTNSATLTGYRITLSSAVEQSQGVVFTGGGGFYPKVISDALDRAVILVQQEAEAISRTAKLAISTPAGVSPQLPAPAANTLLGWNGAGSALINWAMQAGTSLVDLGAAAGSSLIGFTPAGTGAVSRTIQAELRDVVNVLGYDTFAHALAAAAGKALYIPGGTTVTLAADTALPSDIVIYGDGPTSIITATAGGAGLGQLYADGKSDITIRDLKFATDGVISFVPTFKLCTNVLVENCTFDCRTLTNGRGTVALRSQGSDRFKVRDCTILDSDEGIYLDAWPIGAPGTYSDHVEILNCWFEQRGTPGGANPTQIYAYFAKNVLVDGCKFKNIQGTGASDSYALYASDGTTENVVMTNCTSVIDTIVAGANHTMCLYAGNGKSGICANNVLKSTTAANVSTYLYRGGSWDSEMVTGNYSEGGGIQLRGTSDAAIGPRYMNVSDNYVAKIASHAVGIDIGFSQASLGYIKHAVVKGNMVVQTSAGSIYVANCEDALVEGNTCMNWNIDNYADHTVYQIVSAIYVDNQIEANYLVAGRSYQITLAGSTNWVALGSADNNVGTKFTATGADAVVHAYGFAIDTAHRTVLRDNNIGNDATMGAIGFPIYGIAVQYALQNVKVEGTQMNVACTTANYLNTRERYAKGQWIPAVGGTATYTNQTGVWERNGNVVTIYWDLIINAIGTGSKQIISGLPAELTTGYGCGIAAGILTSGAASVVQLGGYVSGTTVVLTGATAAAAGWGNVNFLGNGTEISGSATYLLADA